MPNSAEYTTHVGPADGVRFSVLRALVDGGGSTQFHPAPSGGWQGFDPIAMVDAFGALTGLRYVERDPSAPHYFRITDTGREAFVAALCREIRRAAVRLEGWLVAAELAGAEPDRLARAVGPTAQTIADALPRA